MAGSSIFFVFKPYFFLIKIAKYFSLILSFIVYSSRWSWSLLTPFFNSISSFFNEANWNIFFVLISFA